MKTPRRTKQYVVRWRTANIGWPSLLATLTALAVLGLGGASIGGWGGVPIILVVIGAVIGLVFLWCNVPSRQS